MVVRVARSCPPFAHLLRRRAEDHGGGPLPRSLSPHVRPRGTGRTFRGPLLPRAGEPAPAVCRPCLPRGTQRWGGALRAAAGQTGATWAPECPRQSLHSGLSQTVPASRGLGEVTPGANRKPLPELGWPELAPAGCLVTRARLRPRRAPRADGDRRPGAVSVWAPRLRPLLVSEAPPLRCSSQGWRRYPTLPMIKLRRGRGGSFLLVSQAPSGL